MPNNERPRRRSKLGGALAASTFGIAVASPIAGGLIGWRLGSNTEHSHNAEIPARIVQLERCREYVENSGGSLIVRFDSIPREARISCDMPVAREDGELSQEDIDLINNNHYSHGAEVVSVRASYDTSIRLPDPLKLTSSIQKAERDMKDFNKNPAIGRAIVGALLGFVGSIAELVFYPKAEKAIDKLRKKVKRSSSLKSD